MVKAQILSGGRGKAGGIEIVKTPRRAVEAAGRMLGKSLVTAQTGPAGLFVHRVLVCKAVDIEREIYAAVVMDRRAGRPALVVSAGGGVDVETLAAASPEKVLKIAFDPFRGLDRFQARRAALFAGLTGELCVPAVEAFLGLSQTFLSSDALLVEVNPLSVVKGNRLMAVDAKMVVDDNAAFRQKDLFAEGDESCLAPSERRAHKKGLSYIPLDGSIGCLVNGAGLAMATMDLLLLHGGRPSDFLDVGGGAHVDQVTEAFRILLTDKKVKAILVNIFGGIMKGDVIAQGLLDAVKKSGLDRPLVVRLEGNRAEEGRRLLNEAGLRIVAAADLADAAEKVVAASKGNP